MRRPFRVPGLLPGLLLIMLAGCMPPRQPLPADATVTPPAQWRDEAARTAEISANWWQAFGDPQLTTLVEAALAHNTDVLIAASRVEQAREQIRLSHASLLPNLDAVLGAQRTRELSVLGIAHTTAVQPSLQVSYELDIWGRLRRLREAAQLQYQASEAERDAVRLAVASTTARAYVSLLSLDRQLYVTRETVESRQQALRVAEDRASLGYTSQLELTQAQSEYEAAAQLLPQLKQAIREQEHALRLLTGALPGAVQRGAGLLAIEPPDVPVALPSELLRRRPDIHQAELLLAASDLNLQAQRDRFLPQVQVSASLGQLFVNSLDYDPVRVWDIGASVLAPIFDAGRLEAGVNIAVAQRNEAAFAYRATALQAFAEVENSLSAVGNLRQQIERVEARRAVLERSLTFAEDRYRAGYSSYLETLDAQRNLFNTELTAVQLRESQLNALIGLYQVLGGGWQAAAER
ncbi:MULTISPECIES: efflux transporter outer membrane subunit [Pseudomonadaceae]|uniref:efflux transporter outer membrane subunit n=1 Tax=Pseudomonadaceae TaxID=135621 RepID=UPI0015E2E60C|nr:MULTISPECIES: efflux transporter outer membrane subunit [Pseudomonadaceae]MBA1277259.1 efflux transporter outer membrane subunit [Stutzerimonas stutzeri]MBC8650730.1 efflux transporter outer membrane subunit [Pseudomonas sp. MT4]QXY91505.1 efflux transporter outer membrane subunit [Pseudomonas sp. MTM4]